MGRKALFFVLCACLLTGFVAFEIYANLPLNQIPTQPDDGNPQATASPTNEPSGNQNVDDNPSSTNSPSNDQTTGGDGTQTKPEVPINTDPTPSPHVNEPDHEATADYVWNSSEVIDVNLER